MVSEVLALSGHLGHDRPALASPSAGVRGGAGPGPDRASPGKDTHMWPRASRGPWGHGRPGLGGGRRSTQNAGTVAEPCKVLQAPQPPAQGRRGGEGAGRGPVSGFQATVPLRETRRALQRSPSPWWVPETCLLELGLPGSLPGPSRQTAVWQEASGLWGHSGCAWGRAGITCGGPAQALHSPQGRSVFPPPWALGCPAECPAFPGAPHHRSRAGRPRGERAPAQGPAC